MSYPSVVPAALRKSATDRTAPRSVIDRGCGRWNTARTPRIATRTRDPRPSETSAPSATESASMSVQRMSGRVGCSKTARSVR